MDFFPIILYVHTSVLQYVGMELVKKNDLQSKMFQYCKILEISTWNTLKTISAN